MPDGAPDTSREENTGAPPSGAPGEGPLFPRPLVVRLLVGFAVIFAAALLAGLFLQDPLERLGEAAIGQFGLPGLFIAILLIDSFPTPMSYAPFLLLAIQGGVPVWIVLLTGSLASMSGGLTGYAIGRLVGMPRRIEAWLETHSPEQFGLLRRYGALGVAAVGALPLPFALGTWTAGAMRVRFVGVLLACLVRIPKTGFYVGLIMSGLKLGGAQ